MQEVKSIDTDSVYSTTVGSILEPRPNRWTIWRGTPWNPSCGKISLKCGAKLFLVVYMVQILILATVATLIGIPITYFILTRVQGTECGVLPNIPHNGTDEIPAPVKDEAYERRLNVWDIPRIFVLVAWMLLAAYLCHKCKGALSKGTLSQMKIYFWIICCIIVINSMAWFAVDHRIYSPLYMETPIGILSVFGILFVYNYILEQSRSPTSTLIFDAKFEPL